MGCETVVLFIFNRPDFAGRAFEKIRAAQPKRLFVIADGPRGEYEAEACQAARAATEGDTWDCEVSRLYASENLGCGRRISSGLSWVFSQVDDAIILEDDCIPDPSFFEFCQELLEKYRHNPEVTMISGTSFLNGAAPGGESYLFSRYALIWGWATWARAWERYDFEMKSWQEVRQSEWPETYFPSRAESSYWRGILDKVAAGRIDTWDYQWLYAGWLHQGLGIIPAKNLISNIGFEPRATHTTGSSSLASKAFSQMSFPLQHPARIQADQKIEARIFQRLFVQVRTPLSMARGIHMRCRRVWSSLSSRMRLVLVSSK